MSRKTFKITLTAILSTLSILAFAVENLLPPLFLPGARLGISNVFILLSLILSGVGWSFITLIAKVTLGSLLSGNPSAILYSLPAGLISLTIQILILSFIKKTSVLSASVAGAVINVTVQNVVFCLITNTMEFISYLPYLSLISVFSGLTVGFIVYLITLRLPSETTGQPQQKTNDCEEISN